MSDDLFKGLDLSNAYSMVSGIQADMERQQRETFAAVNAASEERQKVFKNIAQTAQNTSETNEKLEKTNARLETIIDNQNEHIDLLKEQLKASKAQLEIDEKQLTLLRNLFDSNQDSMAVEQEIADLIQQQIDSNHPVKEFLADKGGDLAVAGITAGVPILWSAFKAFLSTKGIVLP